MYYYQDKKYFSNHLCQHMLQYLYLNSYQQDILNSERGMVLYIKSKYYHNFHKYIDFHYFRSNIIPQKHYTILHILPRRNI